MIPSSITQLAESADLLIKEATPLSASMDGIQVNSSHFFEKSMLSIAFHLLLMATYTIGGPISAFDFGSDRALSRWRRLRCGNSGLGLARPAEAKPRHSHRSDPGVPPRPHPDF